MLRVKWIFATYIYACLLFPDQNVYKNLQEKLILAQSGDIIYLPIGKSFISRSLWGDNLNNVTIIGHGIDSTILNFDNQIEGAVGI